MDIMIASAEEYFSRPLTMGEIKNLRLMQTKWSEYERRFSLGFLCLLAGAQLGMMLIDDTWTTLGMCFGVSLVAYCWFKSIIPKYLDRMFPCRICVGDETVVHPNSNALVEIGYLPPSLMTHALIQKITIQNRRLVQFEFEMLKSDLRVNNMSL